MYTIAYLVVYVLQSDTLVHVEVLRRQWPKKTLKLNKAVNSTI